MANAPVILPRGADHAEHHEDPALKHQFDTVEQQYGASMLGMWAFLSTEIMMFGGLFLGYMVYRALWPEAWLEASTHQDWRIGLLNTAVLITSSFTMALGVHAAQTGNNRRALVFLVLTIILAGVFLVNKYFEYSAHIHEGLLPGPLFDRAAYDRQIELFFLFYFIMTGLHGIHVLIGMFLLGYLAYKAWKNWFSPRYYTPVEVGGLYWHFVDIVWIFLFPLLYLIGGVELGGGGGGH